MRGLTHRLVSAVGIWLLALSTFSAPAEASSRFITRTAFGSGQLSPLPAFTVQPTVTPTTGTAGSTVFTATPGTVVKGAISSRAWLLNGVQISASTTASPIAAGTLTYQEVATGSAGTAFSNVISVTVGAPSSLPATLTYALAGSSSPAQFFSTYGYSYPQSVNSQSSTDGTTFANSTQGRMVMESANYIFNATGKKSRWIGTAKAGTTLYGSDATQSWSAASSPLRASLVSAINAYTAAYPNEALTCVITQVGYNDFNDSSASVTTVLNAYRLFFSQTRSETNQPNLRFCVIGTQDSPSAPKSVAAQRQAELTLAGDANVYLTLQTNDAALNDAIHQNEAGQAQTGQRFGQFMTAFVNGTTLPRGAQITAVAPVTDTTTRVTIKQVLGTDYIPSTGITGFLMTNAAGSSIAVSNAAKESATSILLTHASRYDSGVSTVWYLPNGGQTTDDTATTVHDNSPLALPMESSYFYTLPAVTTPAAPTLNALTVSNTAATVGTAYTGTINNRTSGSTFALTGAGAPGLSITGTTISGTPTTAGTVNLVETLAGASNSPRTSNGVITVAAAGGGFTATGKTAQIAYSGNDISSAPATWNTRRSDDKAVSGGKALLTPAGVATGWVDKLLASPAGGANITGNGNAARTAWAANGERYDNGVFKQFWFINAADRAAEEYSGLDNTKFYDIEVSADRDAGAARTTSYIVGGVTKTLQVVGNYPGAAPDASPATRYVLFEKVQPVNGVITLNWGNSTAATFGYLGVVVIREYSGS